MNQQKIDHFKKLLTDEKTLLENELSSIGHRNPDNKKDWEATPPEGEISRSEHEELAEKIEVYEENTAILKQLEIKYNEVLEAIGRIESGNYGMCLVSGDPIEEDRLEANPSATTCKKHMK